MLIVLYFQVSDGWTSSTPKSGRNEISEEKQNNKGKGLFDTADDDDDEGDLFAQKPAAAAREAKGCCHILTDSLKVLYKFSDL